MSLLHLCIFVHSCDYDFSFASTIDLLSFTVTRVLAIAVAFVATITTISI